jgi:hypothetical protein
MGWPDPVVGEQPGLMPFRMVDIDALAARQDVVQLAA